MRDRGQGFESPIVHFIRKLNANKQTFSILYQKVKIKFTFLIVVQKIMNSQEFIRVSKSGDLNIVQQLLLNHPNEINSKDIIILIILRHLTANFIL